MATMLARAISSPIRVGIVALIKRYLSTYISGIDVQGSGVTDDLVFKNLELKLDVLQDSIFIPFGFEVTRGFIKELRISIPWMQLSSKPIRVRFNMIECILTAKSSNTKTKPKSQKHKPSRQRQRSSSDARHEDDPTGWTSYLKRIMANADVRVDNIVFKYVRNDVVLTLANSKVHVFTALPQKGWTEGFTEEPTGPKNFMYKVVRMSDVTISLNRFKRVDEDGRPVLEDFDEMPVLNQLTVEVSLDLLLSSYSKLAVTAMDISIKSPDSTKDPLTARDGGVDLHMNDSLSSAAAMSLSLGAIELSISTRQLDMLTDLLQALRPQSPGGDDEDVCSDTDDAGVSLAPDADAVSAQSVESTSQDTLATDSDPSAWGNYLWGLAFGETEESEAPESLGHIDKPLRSPSAPNPCTALMLAGEMPPKASPLPDQPPVPQGMPLKIQLKVASISFRVLRTHRSVKTGGSENDDHSTEEEELLRVPVPLAVSSDGLLTIRSSQKRRTAKRVHEPMLELHLQALEVWAQGVLGGMEPVLEVFMCMRHVAIRRALPAKLSDQLAHKNWLEWGEMDSDAKSSSRRIPGGLGSSEQMRSRKASTPVADITTSSPEDVPYRHTKCAVRMYMCLPMPVAKPDMDEEISPKTEEDVEASTQRLPLPGAHHRLVVDVSCGKLSARVDNDFLKRLGELARSVNSFRAERSSGVATNDITGTDTAPDVSTSAKSSEKSNVFQNFADLKVPFPAHVLVTISGTQLQLIDEASASPPTAATLSFDGHRHQTGNGFTFSANQLILQAGVVHSHPRVARDDVEQGYGFERCAVPPRHMQVEARMFLKSGSVVQQTLGRQFEIAHVQGLVVEVSAGSRLYEATDLVSTSAKNSGGDALESEGVKGDGKGVNLPHCRGKVDFSMETFKIAASERTIEESIFWVARFLQSVLLVMVAARLVRSDPVAETSSAASSLPQNAASQLRPEHGQQRDGGDLPEMSGANYDKNLHLNVSNVAASASVSVVQDARARWNIVASINASLRDVQSTLDVCALLRQQHRPSPALLATGDPNMFTLTVGVERQLPLNWHRHAACLLGEPPPDDSAIAQTHHLNKWHFRLAAKPVHVHLPACVTAANTVTSIMHWIHYHSIAAIFAKFRPPIPKNVFGDSTGPPPLQTAPSSTASALDQPQLLTDREQPWVPVLRWLLDAETVQDIGINIGGAAVQLSPDVMFRFSSFSASSTNPKDSCALLSWRLSGFRIGEVLRKRLTFTTHGGRMPETNNEPLSVPTVSGKWKIVGMPAEDGGAALKVVSSLHVECAQTHCRLNENIADALATVKGLFSSDKSNNSEQSGRIEAVEKAVTKGTLVRSGETTAPPQWTSPVSLEMEWHVLLGTVNADFSFPLSSTDPGSAQPNEPIQGHAKATCNGIQLSGSLLHSNQRTGLDVQIQLQDVVIAETITRVKRVIVPPLLACERVTCFVGASALTWTIFAVNTRTCRLMHDAQAFCASGECSHDSEDKMPMQLASLGLQTLLSCASYRRSRRRGRSFDRTSRGVHVLSTLKTVRHPADGPFLECNVRVTLRGTHPGMEMPKSHSSNENVPDNTTAAASDSALSGKNGCEDAVHVSCVVSTCRPVALLLRPRSIRELMRLVHKMTSRESRYKNSDAAASALQPRPPQPQHEGINGGFLPRKELKLCMVTDFGGVSLYCLDQPLEVLGHKVKAASCLCFSLDSLRLKITGENQQNTVKLPSEASFEVNVTTVVSIGTGFVRLIDGGHEGVSSTSSLKCLLLPLKVETQVGGKVSDTRAMSARARVNFAHVAVQASLFQRNLVYSVTSLIQHQGQSSRSPPQGAKVRGREPQSDSITHNTSNQSAGVLVDMHVYVPSIAVALGQERAAGSDMFELRLDSVSLNARYGEAHRTAHVTLSCAHIRFIRHMGLSVTDRILMQPSSQHTAENADANSAPCFLQVTTTLESGARTFKHSVELCPMAFAFRPGDLQSLRSLLDIAPPVGRPPKCVQALRSYLNNAPQAAPPATQPEPKSAVSVSAETFHQVNVVLGGFRFQLYSPAQRCDEDSETFDECQVLLEQCFLLLKIHSKPMNAHSIFYVAPPRGELAGSVTTVQYQLDANRFSCAFMSARGRSGRLHLVEPLTMRCRGTLKGSAGVDKHFLATDSLQVRLQPADITHLRALLDAHLNFAPSDTARLWHGPNPLLRQLVARKRARWVASASDAGTNKGTRRHGMDVFRIRDQLSQSCADDISSRPDRGRRLEPLALFVKIAPTYPQSHIVFPRPPPQAPPQSRQHVSAYRFVKDEGSQWLSCQWRYPSPFAVTEVYCEGVECPVDFVRGMGLEEWISGNPPQVTLMSELRAWDDVNCVFVRLVEFPLVFGVRGASEPTRINVPRVSCPDFRVDTASECGEDGDVDHASEDVDSGCSETILKQEFATDVWEIRLAIPGRSRHGSPGTGSDDSPRQELPHGTQCAIDLANYLMAALTLTVKHDACHAVDMANVEVQQMDLRIMLPSALGKHGGGDWAEDILRLRCKELNMQPARWSCNLSSTTADSTREHVSQSIHSATAKPSELVRCDARVQVSADTQNMRYLHWFPLLERFTMLSSVTLRPYMDGPSGVRLELVTTPCVRVNLCRTALLSLSSIAHAFTDAAKHPTKLTPVKPTSRAYSTEDSESVLEWARYVVINQSGSPLWYGQATTIEKLLLPSGSSQPYSLCRDVTIDNQIHLPSSRIAGGGKSDNKSDVTEESDTAELDGPIPVGMRFAFSLGERAHAPWSLSVPIDAPGIYVRRLGRGRTSPSPPISLCVKVVTQGLRTAITLCSSHSLRNLGSLALNVRWCPTSRPTDRGVSEKPGASFTLLRDSSPDCSSVTSHRMLCPDGKLSGALQIRSSETSPWSRRLSLDDTGDNACELVHVAPCPNAPAGSLEASDLWFYMVQRRVIDTDDGGDDVANIVEVDDCDEATVVAIEFWPVVRFVSAFQEPRLVFHVAHEEIRPIVASPAPSRKTSQSSELLEKMAHTPIQLFSSSCENLDIGAPRSPERGLADRLENGSDSDSSNELSKTEELAPLDWTVRHDARNMVGGATPLVQANPSKRLEVRIGLSQHAGDGGSDSSSAAEDDSSQPILWLPTRVPLDLRMSKGDATNCTEVPFPISGTDIATSFHGSAGGCAMAVTVVRSATSGCVSFCCSCPLSISNESSYNLILQRQSDTNHDDARVRIDSRTERQCWWNVLGNEGKRNDGSRGEFDENNSSIDGPTWCRLGLTRSNGAVDWSERFRLVDLSTELDTNVEIDVIAGTCRRSFSIDISSSETADGVGASRLMLTMQRLRYGKKATHGHSGIAALPVIRRLSVQARAVFYNATESRLLVALPMGVRRLRPHKLPGHPCLPLEGWCDTKKAESAQMRAPPVNILRIALELPLQPGEQSTEGRRWSREVVLTNRVALNRLRVMVPCHNQRRHRRQPLQRSVDVEALRYCTHAQMLTISSVIRDSDPASTTSNSKSTPTAAAKSSAGASNSYTKGSNKVPDSPYSATHYVVFRDPQPPLLIRNHTRFVLHFRALQQMARGSDCFEKLEPFSQLEFAWTCLPSRAQNRSASDAEQVSRALSKIPSLVAHKQERVFESYDSQNKRHTFRFRLTTPQHAGDDRQLSTKWSPVLLGCEGARRFVNMPLSKTDASTDTSEDDNIVDIEMRVFNRAGTTVIAFTTSAAPAKIPVTSPPLLKSVSSDPHLAVDTSEHRMQPTQPLALDMVMKELSVLLFDENGIEFKELLFCSLSSLKATVRSGAPLHTLTAAEEGSSHSWVDQQLLLCVKSTLSVRLVVGDVHLENYCSFQLPVMIARDGSDRSAHIQRRRGKNGGSGYFEAGQINVEVTFADTFSKSRVLPFLLMLDVHILPMVVAVEDTSVRELLQKLSPIAKGLFDDGQAEQASASSSRAKGALKSSSRLIKSDRALPSFLVHLTSPRLYMHELRVKEVSLLVTAYANKPVFVGVDRTPLKFAAVMLRHVFSSTERLGKELAANYIADAIIRSPALLGSLQILGNPTNLLGSVARGLWDFVSIPLVALQNEGMEGLWGGVYGASASLVSNVSRGALQSVIGFSSTVARNLDRLSFDPHHMHARERERQSQLVTNSPTSFGSGLWRSFRSVGVGVVGAASSLVTSPLTAARHTREGGWGGAWTGMLTGLATGVAGAVTKPLSGAFDAVSETGNTILRSTGLDEGVQHLRRTKHGSLQLAPSEHLYFRWKVLPADAAFERILLLVTPPTGCAFEVGLGDLGVFGERTRVTVVVTSSELFVLKAAPPRTILHRMLLSDVHHVGDTLEDNEVVVLQYRSDDRGHQHAQPALENPSAGPAGGPAETLNRLTLCLRGEVKRKLVRLLVECVRRRSILSPRSANNEDFGQLT